jgi:hypothetical protein
MGLNLGIKMNIELEEVVVMDVSDDALELAAGVVLRGPGYERTIGWNADWC